MKIAKKILIGVIGIIITLCIGHTIVLHYELRDVGDELDRLEAKVREELPDKEFQIVKDFRSITITRKNVQFLNPISLPRMPEAEIWRKYSRTEDFKISITFVPKLTKKEFQRLLAAQNDLIASRSIGIKPGSKSYVGVVESALKSVQIPEYYSDRFSIYVYTSDENFFAIRPTSVYEFKEKIIAFLTKEYSRYFVNKN